MLNHHSRLYRAVAAPLAVLATLFLSFGTAHAQDAPTTAPPPKAEMPAAETPAVERTKGFDVVFLLERHSAMEPEFDQAKKLVESIIESLRKQAKGKEVRVGFMRYPQSGKNVETIDLMDNPQSISKTLNGTVLTSAVANDGLLIGLHLRRAVDKLSWSEDPDIERRVYIVDDVILRDGTPDPNWGQRVELVGQVPPPDGTDFRTATRYAVSKGFTVSVIHCLTPNQEAYLRDLQGAQRARLTYDYIREHHLLTVQLAEVYYWSRINWLEVAYLGGGEFYTVTRSSSPQRLSPEAVRYRAEVTMPREVLAAQNDEWNLYLSTLLRLRNPALRASR